jgi:uncharacterized membrane protein YfcA
MTTQTIFILIAIGLLAGILSGFVGVGGGSVIVPGLVYMLGFSQHQAQGTSLFILSMTATQTVFLQELTIPQVEQTH